MLILATVKEGLHTFNLIYEDYPPAERRKAWQDWCDFWKPAVEAVRSLAGKK